MNYERMQGNATCYGCPFREWGWHDGGPEFTCALNNNSCCIDSYSDYYHDAKKCDLLRAEFDAVPKHSNEVLEDPNYTGA